MTKEKPWLLSDEEIEKELQPLRDSYFGRDGEIFQRPWGAGYWLYGVEFDESRGWLAYEFDEAEEDPRSMLHQQAIAAWRDGSALPSKYFALSSTVVASVFRNMLMRWGQEGIGDIDLGGADEALQWTILGEQRYG